MFWNWDTSGQCGQVSFLPVPVYTAKNLCKTQQHLDEDEFIDVESYTEDEITDMIYSGKIQDSKTIAAIMAYINKTKHTMQ